MSLKRFIPQKDTTIVAAAPGCSETNFGKDEILELGRALESFTSGPARILVQFSQDDIASVARLVGDHDYRAKVHLSVANAYNVPEKLEIVGTPILESWEEGFGTSAEAENLLGATWTYRMPDVPWFHPGNTSNAYDGERARHEGEDIVRDGGIAETLEFTTFIDGGSALGVGPESDSEYSGYIPIYDVDLDITDLVKYWVSGIVENYGIMIRIKDEDYWATEYGTHISLFSLDTHTVYQPYLEIAWDDSEFNPTKAPLEDGFKIVVSNLQSEYTNDDSVKFSVESKNLYPSRVFSTSSLYKTSYALPKDSLWGVKDEYTNEMLVDFDSDYTKVSSVGDQNYFSVDMNMFYPERFYRLLFKVPTASGTKVVDNKIIFKVTRNGRVC